MLRLLGIVIFLGAMLALGLFAFPFFTHTNVRAGSATAALPRDDAALQESPLIEVPTFVDAEEVENDSVKNLTINIRYPRILLAQHPKLAQDASDDIHAFIQSMEADFRANAAEIPERIVRESGSDFTMRYTPLLLSPTIISLRFDASEYLAGAAHPNNQVRVLTYNLATHTRLRPTDFFADQAMALPFLSSSTRAALHVMFADATAEEFAAEVLPGTAPSTENFDEVGLVDTGLVVLFNPYQVAPYARGVVTINIPLADVSALLAPDAKDAIRMAKENIVEAEPEK